MFRVLTIVLLLLNGVYLFAELIISRVETEDKKTIAVTFQDNPSIYAFLEEECELFYPNKRNQFILPINTKKLNSEDVDQRIYTLYKFLSIILIIT